MRIAILDDNQLDIDYFKTRAESFLKKKGDRSYQISEYTSGVPLVDDVKDGEWFDLIVLDIILKDGESGVDVAYKLRGSGYSGSLMFWTAHAAANSPRIGTYNSSVHARWNQSALSTCASHTGNFTS